MKSFNAEEFLILVVDDVSKNLQMINGILEKVGYATTFATSGQQALDRLKLVKPDLILLDLMMPEIDGLEVCRRLKADTETCEIPVMFLTASYEEKHLLQAFEIGAVDYITKPVNQGELLARLGTQVELKQARDELKKNLVELREARDAALEGAKFKAQFLANISHEIRTPMNAVLGMTDVLLNTRLNSQQSDCVKIIQSSGKNLLTIINEFLDLSKIEAGAMRLYPEKFNLQAVIKELVDLFTPQAQKKEIQIICSFDALLPPELVGDANRLRQIITNLIGNAIKFTEVGEIAIAVAVESGVGTGKESLPPNNSPNNLASANTVVLRFAVSDTGIGISPEGQQKLFQFFSQVDDSCSRQYGGTGLGLAICKQLVELMGGEIGCKSVLGEGSTFWFTAIFEQSPASDKSDGETLQEREEQEKGESIDKKERLKNVKILVVEDSLFNQKVIFNFLEILGYTITEADVANNGQEALDKLAEGDYDIVLMDCQMPIVDGYSATRKLRQLKGKKDYPVVIGVTGYTDSGAIEECLAAGMNDYLSKPVVMEALAAMLEKWRA